MPILRFCLITAILIWSFVHAVPPAKLQIKVVDVVSPNEFVVEDANGDIRLLTLKGYHPKEQKEKAVLKWYDGPMLITMQEYLGTLDGKDIISHLDELGLVQKHKNEDLVDISDFDSDVIELISHKDLQDKPNEITSTGGSDMFGISFMCFLALFLALWVRGDYSSYRHTSGTTIFQAYQRDTPLSKTAAMFMLLCIGIGLLCWILCLAIVVRRLFIE